MTSLFRKLMWCVQRQRKEDELREELQFHLEEEADALRAEGLSENHARRAAHRGLGNVTLVREDIRTLWTWTLLEDIRRDAEYAFRALLRHPTFTVTAVVTLALGIGATTSVFSIVSAVLLRPLPYPNAARLVQIVENVPAEESLTARPMRLAAMNPNEVEWWRNNARSFAAFAVMLPETRTMSAREGTVRLNGARVSAALFEMRAVHPLLGRWLYPDEERPDARVVVIGAETWRRYFGGAPDVVGQTVALDGQFYTIVGVMPATFGNEAFWTPFVIEPPRPGTVELVQATALLRDATTLEAAAAEVNALGSRLRGGAAIGRDGADLPASAASQGPRFEVRRLVDAEVAAVRPALLLLVVAVAVVLLIVCANVANLLLVRGVGRQREIAIRQALGAGRSRLVRQLLTEGLVLALLGGGAGVALAYAGVQLVKAGSVIDMPRQFRNALGPLGTTILPRADTVAVDPTVLAFAIALSLLTGLLFALAPALRLARTDRRHVSRHVPGGTGDLATHGKGSGRLTTRAGHVLAVVQLGLATALLIGSGLLLRSFIHLSTVHLGFDPAAQVFQFITPGEYPRSRKLELSLAFAERLRTLPGVEAAGFINLPPLTGQNIFRNLYLPPEFEAQRDALGEEDRTVIRGVSPGYLPAIGVRLLEGRWLVEDDDANRPRVMMVNRRWAQRFSPSTSAVGKRVTFVTTGRERRRITYEVIGVVDDIRWRMDGGYGYEQSRPEFPLLGFIDLRQLLVGSGAAGSMDRPSMELDMLVGEPGGLAFAVRADGAPPSASALRTLAAQIDRQATVDGATTLGGVVSGLIGRSRFYAVVVTLFGGIAAAIAAIGIYGVLAYAMTQRQHEFGVRLALGASSRDLLRLALGQGVVLVVSGIALGLITALALTRYLSAMLFGLTPLDGPTYAAVVIAFSAVALVASYVPARRAMKVDPLVVLRYE